MGPQVDPHLYRPTRSDIVALIQADAIFYNGLSLEGQMEELLEKLSGSKVVKAVGEMLESSIHLSDPSKNFDPHIWMDVGIWRQVVEIMARSLIELDSANAGLYRRNAQTYSVLLADLQTRVVDILGQIPSHARILVTAHDAFRYFGRAYNFEVIGIQGISTESEAGLKRIEGIVDLLVTKRIRAVFVETSVSERNVLALIEGTRQRGHQVRIGGHLFSDAMGKQGSAEGTYIGMMLHNVTTLSQALSEFFSLR